MPDHTQPTDADAKKNADEIEDKNATQKGARGNVHSEEGDDVPDQEAPPPLPN